jgi:hypothetical protein
MSKEGVLYERVLPHGPVVRIRRTSPEGATPVVAVLEVDRRAGTPREGIGFPPPLVTTEAPSEDDAIARLRPEADDDRVIVQLLRAKGLR